MFLDDESPRKEEKKGDGTGRTLLDLIRIQLPQLMYVRRIARHDALCDLNAARHGGAVGHGVRRGLGVDLDDADAWVVRAGVVLAVAEVADPGLQLARVVFADGVAVRDDGGFAGDGGPLARRVEEGDVDARVFVQVVGLAGFGVGVEEEVETAAFL